MSDTFVHLRLHSAYSLSEGAIHIKDVVAFALENAMPAVGVTDTNNMFGALDFALTACKNGIQPIMGTQLSIVPAFVDMSTPAMAPKPDQLILIAQNRHGYLNILSLLSKLYMDFDDRHLPLDVVQQHAEGVLCLTGGNGGGINRLLAMGQTQQAESLLDTLHDIFADRVYIELHRNGYEDEAKVEKALLDLAYAKHIPLVATNDVFFGVPDMYEAHDAFLCIEQSTHVDTQDRRRIKPSQYFKSSQEMIELFSDIPEAIENTVKIAKRCSYVAQTMPPLLPEYPSLDGLTESQALRDMSIQGLQARLDGEVYVSGMDETARADVHKTYMDRMDYELGVIEKMGFPGYFLIVADFIQWAKTQNIPVGPGRGSGAGSVIAWALKITNLDPIRWGLLFERFLNPERVSMPDFDIDFCQNRRDDVIQYVQNQYGRDKVAQIITFGKLQARAVVRDIGRVLNIPYPQVNRICKYIPNNPTKPTTLQQALESEKALKDEYDADPTIKKLIDLALKTEGLLRHASTHAAGVVIGDRPLQELVPLYRDAKSDMPVTQFNMKFVEQAGLVKFDFLGLTNLSIIQLAVELVNQRSDVDKPLDVDYIDLEHAPTYTMLAQGNTMGVFQLESAGMRKALMQIRPDRLEDIIAAVSLYRPGPMENIPTYIARKHGEKPVEYLHPLLEPVLQETFGIPVYQEQVMQMAQVLAGYTLGGADVLRRAMGKKIQSEMDAQRITFKEGAKTHNNVDEKLANQIFEQINAFAGYGFNKSHAAAYALIAYQTAWLKCNYPVEFMVATMTYALQKTDKLAILVDDLKKNDIALLLPDINQSETTFSVDYTQDKPRVRYAMGALKNVGEQAVDYIVQNRRDNGVYTDIYDFFERVEYTAMNKGMLESLIKVGVFDTLHPNRRQLLENLDSLMKYGKTIQDDKNSDQVGLFGEEIQGMDKPKLAPSSDFRDIEKLQQEHGAVGFYLSAHPLSIYRKKWNRLGVVEIQDIKQNKVQSDHVRMCGVLTSMRPFTTQKGKPMLIAEFTDASGMFSVLFFDENMDKARTDMQENMIYLIECSKKTVRTDGEEKDVRLIGRAVESLDDELSNTADGILITTVEAFDVRAIGDIVTNMPKGRGKVLMRIPTPQGITEIDTEQKITIDGDMVHQIRKINGVFDVEDI